MKSIFINTLAFIAVFAAFTIFFETVIRVHSRHCDGCNWFWCDNYNGQ